MSFLESGKEGARWLAAPLQHSVSRAPGCVHCGRQLETNAVGIFPLSGKCDNCEHRIFDEDEIFDELEY
jgi:hypothetical protein